MRPYRLLLATCLTVTAVSADEVLFKSGDRLTGTVKSVADGKMSFASKVAGDLTLKLDDIATFSTDGPVTLVLADGTSLAQTAAPADAGVIRLQPEAGAPARLLPLADLLKLNPEPVRWKGAVVAGATFARGNTHSETASLAADAVRRSETDRISLGAAYFSSKQRDNTTRKESTTADNWFLKGQYDHFFSAQTYGYGNLRYEKDRIANLEKRVSPGLGFGYQWAERKDRTFSTEGGASWIYEQYSEPSETRTYLAGRLAYHLDQAFNDHVKAFHNLEYLPSLERFDAFLVNADIGLRAALTASLVLEAKAQMAHNAQPADNRDKNDLRYILGLGWTF